MAIKVNTQPKIRLWFGVFAISVLLAAGAIWWFGQSEPVVRRTSEVKEAVAPPKLVSAQTKLAFVGDIFLGRGVDAKARATDNHAAYPFANLDELQLEDYQAVVGNLECPSVNDEVDYQQQFELLLFNCPTSYLPELAKHFDVVSLANNHTDNQGGQAGLKTTRQNLADQKIEFFGNYEPAVLEDICKLIPIEVELIYSDNTKQTDEIAVQFCGYHTVFRHASASEIAAIAAGSSLPTFVMPHAGAEYRAEPIPGKVAEFRAMIDAGADVVVGAHPHWVQTAEVYQGKLIAYSLGNFIFDQPPGETSLGALLSTQLSINDTEYLKHLRDVADNCQSLSNCEQLANLQKPDLDLTYDVEAVDITDYRPQPAAESSRRKVEQRLKLGSLQQ